MPVALSMDFTISSAALISSKRFSMRPKRTCERFFSHSKYDTVTPPAFRYMSGMTQTPFCRRIASPSAVIGPFAPSAMIFALIRGAFSPRDHVLERGRHQDVAVEHEGVLAGEVRRARETR